MEKSTSSEKLSVTMETNSYLRNPRNVYNIHQRVLEWMVRRERERERENTVYCRHVATNESEVGE
jgi:hypothetical protein